MPVKRVQCCFIVTVRYRVQGTANAQKRENDVLFCVNVRRDAKEANCIDSYFSVQTGENATPSAHSHWHVYFVFSFTLSLCFHELVLDCIGASLQDFEAATG